MRALIVVLAMAVASPAAALPGLACRLSENGVPDKWETRILEINPSKKTAQIFFGELGPAHADAYESDGLLAFSFWRHDGSSASIAVSREDRPEGYIATFADYGPNSKTPRWVRKGHCRPFEGGA